jgi:glycogen operon protein
VLADDPRYYFDTTGCGNTVNTRHPRVVQMVMDSLRYWVEECHVDGFRFDLAVSLTRDRDAVDFNSPFLDAVTQDPVLAKVKMISESWDLGQWGYQVGAFPPGWAEWNGRFRDDIRAYVKGDDGNIDALARNMLGSGDIFDRRGRRPWASINFITAHDGFTLADLYAYNEKHNEANGEDNRDGHDDNRSWNCGVEGPTEDPDVLALRDRMRRFAMATMIVSQGVPMLLMGDESGRTQQGNNNAYCQDNELAWMAWSTDPRDEAFCGFVSGALRLRQELDLLAAGSWLRGEPVAEGGLPGVRWLRPDAEPMTEAEWNNGAVKALALALADAGGSGALILSNAAHEDVPFVLPEAGPDRSWRLRLDSATGAINADADALPAGHATTVAARSLQLYSLWPPTNDAAKLQPRQRETQRKDDDQDHL